MAAKRIAIYDMDGTIVDSTHRYRTMVHVDGSERIDLEHWRANEYRAYQDKLLPLAKQYQEDLNNPDVLVIIATARVLHDADECFIRDKLGSPNAIVSRGTNDSRSGKELKVKGLSRLFNLKGFKGIKDIIFYEDNIEYLKAVCIHFNCLGVFVPSKQGH